MDVIKNAAASDIPYTESLCTAFENQTKGERIYEVVKSMRKSFHKTLDKRVAYKLYVQEAENMIEQHNKTY